MGFSCNLTHREELQGGGYHGIWSLCDQAYSHNGRTVAATSATLTALCEISQDLERIETNKKKTNKNHPRVRLNIAPKHCESLLQRKGSKEYIETIGNS